jgi:hypothetical protein
VGAVQGYVLGNRGGARPEMGKAVCIKKNGKKPAPGKKNLTISTADCNFKLQGV